MPPHTYDLAIVAPNVYMISWLEANGNTLTVVLNLNEMRIGARKAGTNVNLPATRDANVPDDAQR